MCAFFYHSPTTLISLSVIAQLLEAHGGASTVIADRGLRAANNLAFGNDRNKALLGDAGACKGECECDC